VAKQFLIYDNIQPLSSDAHRTWAVAVENYLFASKLVSVPLVSSEILIATHEFPVVFSALSEGVYVPIAIMGLREGENLLMDEQGRMTTRYVPGFIRRYPFIIGTESGDNMLMGIDIESSTISQDGSKGNRLFTDNGEQTDYLKKVIEFVSDYQHRSDVVKVFCQRLHELNLLEPMQANVTVGSGESAPTLNLRGFYVVSREKLKALSDEQLLDLFKKEGLELIFAHLFSLANINTLTQKLAEKIRS
jgi:hypothetical protein